MKKAVLIGLGTITAHYRAGIDASSVCELVGTADINELASSRELYGTYPFYTDYKEMLSAREPELAIISTPPETHGEIAGYCLRHGVGVLIEKPAVLSISEFDALAETARARGLVFSTMFHWQGGIELKELYERRELSDVNRIEVKILDPYCEDGETIREDRVSLLGAWIDSGVNALSMISARLPLKKAEILHSECRRCKKTGLPIYVRADLSVDGCEVCIEIDWTKHEDRKESVIFTRDKTIRINHSAQSIDDGKGEISYARTKRLDEHYIAVFDSIRNNAAESRTIHELLLEVNAKL